MTYNCQYCKKYGKDNKLEYIPNRLQYYCKICEYRYSKDEVEAQVKPKKAKKSAPKKTLTKSEYELFNEDELKELTVHGTDKLVSKKA